MIMLIIDYAPIHQLKAILADRQQEQVCVVQQQ